MAHDGIPEGPSPKTGGGAACSDCFFFRAFPWYVQRHDGYCGRPEVARSQAGRLFVTEADHMCCRLHLSFSDYIAALGGAGGPDEEG